MLLRSTWLTSFLGSAEDRDRWKALPSGGEAQSAVAEKSGRSRDGIALRGEAA